MKRGGGGRSPDWSGLAPFALATSQPARQDNSGEGGLRWEPEPAPPQAELAAPSAPDLTPLLEDEADDLAAVQARFRRWRGRPPSTPMTG